MELFWGGIFSTQILDSFNRREHRKVSLPRLLVPGNQSEAELGKIYKIMNQFIQNKPNKNETYYPKNITEQDL